MPTAQSLLAMLDAPMAAASGTDLTNAAAARAALEYLTTPAVARVFRSRGLEPA